MVNVDLLVQDEQCRRTLLSWRNDPYNGAGWHIPGGIVRFKERVEARIEKVAEIEIGVAVQFASVPIAVYQSIHNERDIRGHFISFLYQCFLVSTFEPHNRGLTREETGYLAWHDHCPVNLLPVHEIYRHFIDNKHKKSNV